MSTSKRAIVIGAGIVGLAHARALSMRGWEVQVFERHPQAVGASIRNFGMVWPVGQPDGVLYERAMRSRSIWHSLCSAAGIWYQEAGSLHIATQPLEADIMQDIATHYQATRAMQWWPADKVLQHSAYAHPQHTLGGLYSPHELIVESREAIHAVAKYLQQQGVEFHFGTAISRIEGHTVWSGQQQWQADRIFVCSGADFETLYPVHFAALNITKCKLQMLRLGALPEQAQLGPALCGGLSLIHYKGFEVSPHIAALRAHYQATLPQYVEWGIHVMACQNPYGELTVGDTHEYGLHLDPFDRDWLNQLVLDYLGTFSTLHTQPVVQSWNGTYAKMTNGATEHIQPIDDVVTIVNGLGGAGMTLSFGLAEEVVAAV